MKHRHRLKCQVCESVFIDACRRSRCRKCSLSDKTGLLPWSDVTRKWNAMSGEDISEAHCRGIAAVALAKLKREIEADPWLNDLRRTVL